MTKERAQDIVNMLTHTLKVMGEKHVIRPTQSMFKSPRARRSDLINKRAKLKKRFKI